MQRTVLGGFFIAVEGIDGAGKSTICSLLAEKLQEIGYAVLLTREPGGTPLGIKLRELLINSQNELIAEAGFLLFAADRAQHVRTVIQPALKEGKIVITDRFSDSSLAYQGYGKQLSLVMIKKVNEWVSYGQTPALTLYLQISVADALMRVKQRNTGYSIFEQREFLNRVVDGFEQIFLLRPDVLRISAMQEKEVIVQYAVKEILSWIEKR